MSTPRDSERDEGARSDGQATDAEYGLWWLAGLMIVIASWLLYRYVAPKGWREWGRAGLVQAFVIALYPEMYGFPLTIYVLTTVLGVQSPGCM